MDYEYLENSEVEKWLVKCEGWHFQQAAYSTFHKSLTQVCFGCKKVRSSILKKLDK